MDEYKFLMPKQKRSKIKIVLIILVILIFAFLSTFVYFAINLSLAANKLKSTADLLQDQLTNKNWHEADDSLALISSQVKKIDSDLRLAAAIYPLPFIKNKINAPSQLISAAEDLLAVGDKSLAIVSEVSSQLESKNLELDFNNIESKKIILQSIDDNRSEILKLTEKIDEAQKKLEKIDNQDLIIFGQSQLVDVKMKMKEAVTAADFLVPLIADSSEIFGYNEEKNYLLLFQNNTEMRPTGGFIGSYGIITVKNGDITNVFTDDIYNLDKHSEGKMDVAAPKPFVDHTQVKKLFMRDANWSPDWPTSVDQLVWFFNQEMSNAGKPAVKLDGVIGITPDLISHFLTVVGPVVVASTTFNADNFTQELQYLVEFGYEDQGVSRAERKGAIGQISEIILDKIKKLPLSNIQKIAAIVKKDFDEKQIIAYFNDHDLQQNIVDRNWGQTISTASSTDYLMVIDANLMALKTDRVMTKTIEYKVSADDIGNLSSKLNLNYSHSGEKVEGIIGQYRDYVRIYVPLGSQLTKAELITKTATKKLVMDNLTEFNKTVFGAYFIVQPGEQVTLKLEYKLPDKLKKQYQKGEYVLAIQKQAGTSGHKLKIGLDFSKYISSFDSPASPTRNSGRIMTWDTQLKQDQQYNIKF